MPWIQFSGDFDHWTAPGRACVAYKAGQRVFVTRECAWLALAAGKAAKSSKPKDEPAEAGETAPPAALDSPPVSEAENGG